MSATLIRREYVVPDEMRRPAQKHSNIGSGERTLSAAAGALLLGAGALGSGRTRVLTLVSGGALLYRAWSGNCTVYRALGINRNVHHSAAATVRHKRGVHFDRSIIIAKPPEIIFKCWRNLQDLPNFIDHLDSVTLTEGNRSHWVARGPLGVEL
jgi:uncharacterized membrane protein